MRVLFDGWSLLHHPLNPASLHLLSILENLPDEISPVLALPAPAPGWLDFPLPKILPTQPTPWGRLRWEQSFLPSLANKFDVNLLHLVSPTAPALSSLKTVFSPTAFGAGISDWSGTPDTFNHVLDRWRTSLGLGGLVRAGKILWPDDLPTPGPVEPIPPILPLKFAQHPGNYAEGKIETGSGELDLPEEFILYHGPGGRRHLEILLQAWKWAAPAIGELYPLLLVGLDREDSQVVSELGKVMDLGDSLVIMPSVTPAMLPDLYQLSTAVFHPAPASPWCGPVRLALASGKPLVATEDKLTAEMAGPAAYLVNRNDSRALGAALVTVVVERELAQRLSAAGKLRARDWVSNEFSEQLLGLYASAHRMG
jgi:hypothetical protein